MARLPQPEIEEASEPTLERLIAVKEKLDRPKDRPMLVILKATRDERLKK